MDYKTLRALFENAQKRIRDLEQELAWQKKKADSLLSDKLHFERDRIQFEQEIEHLEFLLVQESEYARRLEEENAAWKAKYFNDDFYNES